MCRNKPFLWKRNILFLKGKCVSRRVWDSDDIITSDGHWTEIGLSIINFLQKQYFLSDKASTFLLNYQNGQNDQFLFRHFSKQRDSLRTLHCVLQRFPFRFFHFNVSDGNFMLRLTGVNIGRAKQRGFAQRARRISSTPEENRETDTSAAKSPLVS